MFRYVAALFLIVYPCLASAQSPPDAGFLINLAISRQKESKLFFDGLGYIKNHAIEELEGDGEIRKRTEMTIRGEYTSGSQKEILVSKAGKEYSPAPPTLEMDDILLSGRYNYSYEGMTVINGRTVFAVRVEPRHQTKQPPDKGNGEQKIKNRILNNLTGTIYIDSESYTIWRAEIHLNKPPIKIYIARLYQLDVTIEQQEFCGIPVLKQVTAIYRYDKFFFWFQTFKRELFAYGDYSR